MMDNENVIERTENMDREQVDGIQKDKKILTKSSMEFVHNSVGMEVTQHMRAVTVAVEPVTTYSQGGI